MELFENPDAARARAAQPASPEMKEPLDSTTMTMASFKKAIRPFNANSPGIKATLLSEQSFRKKFGHPFETQRVGDLAMWYYKCSDGMIQLVIEAVFLQQQGVVIKDVNEQSLPGGAGPATDNRLTPSSTGTQARAENEAPTPRSQSPQPMGKDEAGPAQPKATPDEAVAPANTGNINALADGLEAEVQSRYNQNLWNAASKGNLIGVRASVGVGAEVNSTDPDGNTAIILASRNGRSQVAKYLLTKGADVGKTNRLGQTALDVANVEEMKTILKEAAQRK